MKQLPARSNLDHLKKQAKDLLRLYKNHDPEAFVRLRDALPVAARKDDASITALELRLHDMQSCIAREYGFASWADLKSYLEAQAAQNESHAERVLSWLRVVYAGEVAGTPRQQRPVVAARMLTEDPDLTKNDPYLACAVGDEETLRTAVAADPAWVNRPGGPLNIPPLVAVTHSSLLQLPAFRDRLHRSARLLLDAGADPSAAFGNRYPPASLSEPSSEQLSALYGAAGKYFDAELTRMLLKVGANPNDNESLYHSLENIECTRALLEAGARITGTNAFYRVFDLDNLELVHLFVAFGVDPNEFGPHSPIASPLLWAIRRRRSPQHVEALLRAGADPFMKTADGISAYRMAVQYGLREVAQLLERAGASEPLAEEERFVCACAGADEQEARRMLIARPGLLQGLSPQQLRQLPELAANRDNAAVRLMVELGWPIEERGGDLDASALNFAVVYGDVELTRFLLEHGAQWTGPHKYGGDVSGSLGWGSINFPPESGDWVGCAQALIEHGMPGGQRDSQIPDCLVIAGKRQRFSEEVSEFLIAAHRAQSND